MKLADWADKQGIAYLTAYRWFKAGKLPVKAYQSESGTIIVQDESETLELSMSAAQSNDIMSVVLKKTVEFSKNNASVEDFAAWILSNFTLKPNGSSDGPRYSRVKPAPEMVQNHFKQFLKPKGEKPKPNAFVPENPNDLEDLVAKSDDLTAKELVDEIHKIGASAGAPVNPTDAPEVEELMKDLSSAINTPHLGSISITSYDDLAEGVVTRSVDLTPQQLNYTGSNDYAFGNNFSTANSMSSSLVGTAAPASLALNASAPVVSSMYAASVFQPTQKEVESSARLSAAVAEKPRRGRKPKNQGKK